jgi:hypothetical protein
MIYRDERWAVGLAAGHSLMQRPPTRCVGHVPDCLAGTESAQVINAANEMLDA